MRTVLDAGGSCPSRHEGRFTDNPPGIAMELPRHASKPAPQGAAGAFSLVVGGMTWPASMCEPEKHSCGDVEPALSPFGAVRPKASLSRCESWRWRGCASGFVAATVRRKQFPLCCADSSRDKFFSPPGPPQRCGRKRCSPPVPRRPDHNKDAAWKKTSEAGREYISVTLDDPSFPATVYARLIEGEGGTHDLIWSRSKPQAA